MNPTQIPCVTSERKNNNYKIHLVSPRKGKPFYKAKEVTIIDCFTYGLIRNSHRIDPFKHYSWLTDFVSEIQNEEGLVFVSPDWEWMKDEYKQNILNEKWLKLHLNAPTLVVPESHLFDTMENIKGHALKPHQDLAHENWTHSFSKVFVPSLSTTTKLWTYDTLGYELSKINEQNKLPLQSLL